MTMEQAEAIALLQESVSEFNSIRSKGHSVDLAGSDLRGLKLSGVDLRGCNLAGAQLRTADLTNARLDGANLSGATLRGATLQGASLQGSNLTEADLFGTNLTRASLKQAKLLGASLGRAVLIGTDLRSADLSSASVAGVTYSEGHEDNRCLGVHAATCFGNARFRRYVLDRDYMECLANDIGRLQGPMRLFWALAYRAWGALTGHGRSLVRVVIVGMLVALAFGLVYTGLGPDHLAPSTALSNSTTELGIPAPPTTPFYFSLATFMTLGSTDLTPVTSLAQLLVVSEVLLGYLTLGLLVSILADRVARRA